MAGSARRTWQVQWWGAARPHCPVAEPRGIRRRAAWARRIQWRAVRVRLTAPSSETWKGALLVPVAIMWGFLSGWKILLISYPISMIVTGSMAWQLDRASWSVPKLRSPWVWWLLGLVGGLSLALVVNILIQVRPEGVWQFTRSGEGATIWRVCGSFGCATAGAVTLALWRRIAHGRISATTGSG